MVEDAEHGTLHAFVADNAQEDATKYTDEARAYFDSKGIGY